MAFVIVTIFGITPKDFYSQDQEECASLPLTDLTMPIRCDIPSKFCGVDSWPKQTDLQCWFCDLTTDSYPKFIPSNPRVELGEECCDVTGNFHEWSCVVAFIRERFKEEYVSDALKLVYMFEEKFSGKRKTHIQSSPPRTKLKSFCGESGMTDKEYAEAIEILNR